MLDAVLCTIGQSESINSHLSCHSNGGCFVFRESIKDVSVKARDHQAVLSMYYSPWRRLNIRQSSQYIDSLGTEVPWCGGEKLNVMGQPIGSFVIIAASHQQQRARVCKSKGQAIGLRTYNNPLDHVIYY